MPIIINTVSAGMLRQHIEWQNKLCGEIKDLILNSGRSVLVLPINDMSITLKNGSLIALHGRQSG